MIVYSAFARQAHGGRPTVPLALSAEERARFEEALRPAKAEQRLVRSSVCSRFTKRRSSPICAFRGCLSACSSIST
jgi:hypothetical protein